jgi:hypothetical protein
MIYQSFIFYISKGDHFSYISFFENNLAVRKNDINNYRIIYCLIYEECRFLNTYGIIHMFENLRNTINRMII